MNRFWAPYLTRDVLVAVLYTLALFVAGSWPQGPETELVFVFQDKVLHMLAFGGLAVLVWRAIGHLWPSRGRGWLLGLSLALTSLLGGLLELWQALLPSRQADPFDWLADVLGAAVATLGLWRFHATWSPLPGRGPASKS